MKAIKATHVIIGGIVFPWEAKAPYTPSGKSVLGALEYNQEEDKIKCHVCGGWYQQLSGHLGDTDGVTARAYKISAGLNQTTGLCVPRLTLARRQVNKCKAHLLRPFQKKPGCRVWGPKLISNNRAEFRNLSLLCQAQIRQRIMKLALDLGHTPTDKEMRTAGLREQTVCASLGMPVRSVFRSLGLVPNSRGNKSVSLLPLGLRAQYEGRTL